MKVAIVGSGASWRGVLDEPASTVVYVASTAGYRVPHADYWVSCDHPYWRTVIADPEAPSKAHRIYVGPAPCPKDLLDAGIEWLPRRGGNWEEAPNACDFDASKGIYCAANSGYAAAWLGACRGARRVALYGLDCNHSGVHESVNNRWRKAVTSLVGAFRAAGIEVIWHGE